MMCMRDVATTLVLAVLPVTAVACGTAGAESLGNSSSQEAAMNAPGSMAGRSTVYAPNGMVATSQPMASSVALGVLRDGGNAFDAAIAASSVLSLVEPHMTGLGGDLFALFWSAEEGRLVGLDATGRAGTHMTPERIRADGYDRVPGSGPGAVTVPGAIAGWGALNEKYGSRPLAEIVAPAIALAEEGFPVTPIIAGQWQGQLQKLKADPGAAATYLIDGERAPEAGEWFRNPDFARSLRTIGAEGPAAMYGGELGTRVAEGLAELGGYLTPEDMAAMEVRWVEPLSMDYKGWTVWELPPAGQGVAALQMLGMLEPFDLASMGHNSPAYLHHLIEAKKVAFADLARHVGDADHMEIDPKQLLDPDYLASRRALINPAVAAERVEPGEFATATETIYLSVADRYGNMVSFIHSIYGSFGSGVVVPGTGFVLQNRGRRLHAGGRAPEPGRARQAALPHAHPRVRDAGRRAADGVRRHGRVDAAAGAHAGRAQHDRVRDGPAAGDRRGPLPPHGRTPGCGRAADRRTRGRHERVRPRTRGLGGRLVRRRSARHEAGARLGRRVRPPQGRPRHRPLTTDGEAPAASRGGGGRGSRGRRPLRARFRRRRRRRP